MSITENSEDFIVCRGKVGVIDSFKGKIERLFGTRIYFNEVSRDGDKEKRWIKVTGGKWDRQNAKTYILGLSDPDEIKTIRCPAGFIDAEVLEDIERNTQAVLSKPTPNSVKISGNELAVTLALSALEDLSGCSQDVDTDSIPPDIHASSEKTRDRSASQRLDEKLDETFGDGSGSLHHLPASIKRAFLECGKHHTEDFSESHLHGSGLEDSSSQNSRRTASEVIVRTRKDQDPRKTFTAPICRVGSPDISPARVVGGDMTDGIGERRSTEGVSTVTEQLASAAQITPVTHQVGRTGRGNSAESLREFAKNVGYTDEEVDEGFLYVKPPMKPTEFLDILKNVKEGKKKLGLGDNSAQREMNDVNEDKTFHDEDDDIIIVDDHFKSPNEKKKSPPPKSKPGGLSKKEKKRNEQKQQDLAKEFRQQQNRTDDKKKHPSPQSVNSSGTKRKSDPDSDQEQTCVMKVWDSDAPSRAPQIPPRQQRLVCPVQPGNDYTPVQIPVVEPRIPPNILSQHPVVSRPSHSPVHSPKRPIPHRQDELRYVIIDGSNVAMFHGNNKCFSCKGIQIAVDYFLDRGHKVTVFVPEWRKYRNFHDNKIRDQEILQKLEESEHLVFTPSRKIQGKLVASYDDRFILSLAEKEDSIILSNDQYRDLMREKVSWKKIVEERLLMYRFVGDHFMPAEDPLGRNGPMLDEFLKKNPHPQPTVQAQVPFHQQQHHQHQIGILPQPVNANMNYNQWPAVGTWQTDGHAPEHLGYQRFHNGGQGQWQAYPEIGNNQNYHSGGQGQWSARERQPAPRPQRQANPQKQDSPRRHDDVTADLLKQLKNVFPESWQEEKIKRVLENHSSETDLNRLTNYCMEIIFK